MKLKFTEGLIIFEMPIYYDKTTEERACWIWFPEETYITIKPKMDMSFKYFFKKL